MSCFVVENGDASLVTDPFDPKEVGISLPKQKADMVLYTQDPEVVSDKARERVEVSDARAASGKELLEISEPGEYEVGGIFVRVCCNPTIAMISVNGVNVCYLGLASSIEGKMKLDDLGEVNYLIIPVGDGEEFLDWKSVGKMISDVDPGVVIPSCYRLPDMGAKQKDLKELSDFAKELGIAKIEEDKKLRLQQVVATDESQYKLVQLELMKS